MRNLLLVSILLAFTLSCSSNRPVVRRVVQRQMGESKPVLRTVKATSTQNDQATTDRGKALETKPTAAIQQRPAVEPEQEAAQEPKVAEPGEKAPEPANNSDLQSRLRGERAATKEEIAAEEELMEEITGLIFEETMTKVGYDFYEYFFIHWEPPEAPWINEYNILIEEKASPIWGSWVQVYVNGIMVWSNILKPRASEAEDYAKEAVEITQQYFQNYQDRQIQEEEMIGTGI